MLPQGFGREELLKQLKLPETAEESADWRLLLAGAGNPIGNLRVKEAAEWLAQKESALRGFGDDEVAAREEDFSEFLASQGLFVAGSSGVQGEWPKLLLTRADDGLLYLDHTLPDHRARVHYIVKFGRGRNPRLAQILRHESVYMDLALRLGLRVHAPLSLRDRALFIPRFDRRISQGGVERLGQESIAAMTGTAGFGIALSHDEVCRRLVRICTDPQTEVLEYLRRDAVNLALGNKDNHARNTALQRDFNGRIGLTPLFDFAPMYLHPDGIARRSRWDGNDDGRPDWTRVLDSVCAGAMPQNGDRHEALDRQSLANGLRAMAPMLWEIAQRGEAMGMEADVHAHLRKSIEDQARQLEAVR
ncbi:MULTISPECIES: HipA domain-containing protein [unclassified Variovorax]|uniref:type II toxin-antitoxin system HipA family toxin n=1 Tax=unclassified Variovorax TaxID=663243 RepID=UPI0033655C2E